MMDEGIEKNILDFFAEAGMLKRVKRSGWWMTGACREESVAEHSFRCAVIGYTLARMEGADPLRVLLMSLFNDIHEARTGDGHKVAHRYLDFRSAEKKAFREQIGPLPSVIAEELNSVREEHDAQSTRESVIARDADILECLVQAKEFLDEGSLKAEKFFEMAPGHLVTRSARSLWEKVSSWDSSAWWEKLGKFER